MIRKKLAAAAAVCIMVFALGAAAAGAEAEYSWTAQNTVEISGAAASGKAGVNVVVQILKPGEDTVTFMHQLGNHGPAYSKRYPKTFEKYTPVCEDGQLQKCSRQSIINAYDNSVFYTDHFLAGVIDWLKGMDTGLLYVSDHGESLGENNLYLHGAPEFMAPSVQKEVPMFLWLSNSLEERLKLDTTCFRKVLDKEASHDNLYSSLLGLLDVK